jgi:hypothetical protein
MGVVSTDYSRALPAVESKSLSKNLETNTLMTTTIRPHRDQFAVCHKDGTAQLGVRTTVKHLIRKRDHAVIQTFNCLKFGGICSSSNEGCRKLRTVSSS